MKEENNSPLTKKPSIMELRRIFMQYIDQEAICMNVGTAMSDEFQLSQIVPVTDVFNRYVLFYNNFSILLRSLKNISDEDKIEVGKIAGHLPEYYTEGKKQVLQIGDMILQEHPMYLGRAFQWAPKMVDFLRSRGYAMPYGHYSVNQLAEAGVYKLISND